MAGVRGAEIRQHGYIHGVSRIATGSAVLGGRFLVGRELRGGAGRTVWAGTEIAGGGPVRIERAPERAVSPATIMRLEHARAALPEGVPGLVAPVRAVGREDDGIHLVTAMPPGASVDGLADGPLPLPDALAVAADVLTALAELHARGILHRDLDGAAVTLRDDGATRATITAAGLAADVALIASVTDLPAEEVAHLAPEASGLIAGGVDERSDLWSAGVLIHRCITGRPPREAATAAELLRETLAGPVPGLRRLVPDAPRVVEEAVGRLLERDPRDRYQSARAAAADFAAIAEALARGDAHPEVVLGAKDDRAALTEPAFVGRRAELAELEAQIGRARQGAGGLVLPGGAVGGRQDPAARRAGGPRHRGRGVGAARRRRRPGRRPALPAPRRRGARDGPRRLRRRRPARGPHRAPRRGGGGRERRDAGAGGDRGPGATRGAWGPSSTPRRAASAPSRRCWTPSGRRAARRW